MLRGFAEVQLLGFLPLFTLVAYWTRIEAVLFVISFMFPMLMALQELARRRLPEPAAEQPAAAAAPQAERDGLTGCHSRAGAMARLAHHLVAERTTGRVTAVMQIDIDNFRNINDRYGMGAGDLVLRTVAERIAGVVRENDLVARIDGDAFAVVLAPVRKVEYTAVHAVAERIQIAVAEPVSIDRITAYVTCTIGLCLMGRAPENTAASMLRAAETALTEARRQGPGAIRSFSPKMRREASKAQSLTAGVEAALENGQIRPWFQPQVSTDTGQVVGFEALARWEHPSEGVLLPHVFLKAVETAGRAERLGEVVMFHALSALKSWDKAGLRVPAVGVNFSTEELRNPKLVEKIKWEVDRFDLEPHRINIEILETVVSDTDDDTITRNIRALSGLGFGIDLDDFGTGQASIANIRRFGVNRIKIDRSFVTHVDSDREQQMLIGAILRMAESLGIESLAEGVESIAEQSMMAQLGCRHIQGFGLARPMPFEDTIAWLHRHNDKLARGADLTRRVG
jgi:diguanylate cyclase (GGDEF)-like protein